MSRKVRPCGITEGRCKWIISDGKKFCARCVMSWGQRFETRPYDTVKARVAALLARLPDAPRGTQVQAVLAAVNEWRRRKS